MTPEIQNYLIDNEQAASLLAGREIMAIRQSKSEQFKVLTELDGVVNYDSHLQNLTIGGIASDSAILMAEDCMALDAVGLPYTSFMEQRANTKQAEIILTHKVGDVGLEFERYSDGYAVRATAINDNANPDTFRQTVSQSLSERYAKSPAHAAIHRALSEAGPSWQLPAEVTTDDFPVRSDAIGTLAFLQKTLITSDSEWRRLSNGDQPEQLIDEFLQTHYPNADTDQDQELSYTWGNGAVKSLYYNPAKDTLRFSVRQVPVDHFGEKANQNPDPDQESMPFVTTEAAKSLLASLDEAGLTLNPQLQYEIMDTGHAKRYGGMYTAISRELAKWVSSPDRLKVSNLFVPKHATLIGTDIINQERTEEYAHGAARQIAYDETLETEARAMLLVANATTGNKPADALIAIAQSSLQREPTGDLPSDLPVTTNTISMTEGSCFDVFYYYSEYSKEPGNHPGLSLETQGNTTLLHKTKTGKESFLSTKPLVFNGVELPKGALFQRSQDGGFAFTRLTPFTFDNPEDQLAFGSEVTKAYKREYRAIQRLGKTSLQRLTELASTRRKRR